MPMIRRVRRRHSDPGKLPHQILGAVAVVLALVLLPAALAAQAEGAAAGFIRTLGDTAVRELAPDDITPSQREAKFRELLHANFDLPRITRFVLGRYARRASTAELARFTALYEDLAVLSYAEMFGAYEGHVFNVRKELGAPGDKYVMVVSELSESGGKLTARLDWQLLVRGSGYAVVDVRVEGVSMAIAQRDEFTAILDGNGGDMAALLEELADTVRKLRDAHERGG
jgi:phospholipid transport system substrate-binding protein